MKHSHTVTILFSLFFLSGAAFANLEVSVASLESASNKTLVKLDTKNTFDQGIKDARAWVFLMDAEGKVVGNQAQWIIGGDSSQKAPLEAEDSQTFKVAISTTSKPTTAKVTFSKIILADGTKVNPHKSLVAKSK